MGGIYRYCMLNFSIFALQILFLFLCTLFCTKKGDYFLLTLIVLQSLFANLFVLKQIQLFGLEVTASDALSIGSMMSLGIYQEFFGKDKAKTAANLTVLVTLFLMVFSSLHLLYMPSVYDTSQEAYSKLFMFMPRLFVASLLAQLISQRIDINLFNFLQRKYPHLNLSMRIALSSLFAQLVDTILFSVMGLLGMVHNLFHVILLSYLIKGICIGCFFIFLRLFKKVLQIDSHVI